MLHIDRSHRLSSDRGLCGAHVPCAATGRFRPSIDSPRPQQLAFHQPGGGWRQQCLQRVIAWLVGGCPDRRRAVVLAERSLRDGACGAVEAANGGQAMGWQLNPAALSVGFFQPAMIAATGAGQDRDWGCRRQFCCGATFFAVLVLFHATESAECDLQNVLERQILSTPCIPAVKDSFTPHVVNLVSALSISLSTG